MIETNRSREKLRTTTCAAAVLVGSLSALAAPDSREIVAYATLRPSNLDLYLFEAPGREPRRLTADPGFDYNPVFSPEGRWVVFCSERRGNPDLYALDLESGGEPRLLAESEAMEDAPAFSPDGRVLAFVSDRDGNADVFVMPFRPGDPKATSEAVNLTRRTGGDFNPAFSPDGRTIAFSSDRDRGAAEYVGVASVSRSQSDVYVMNVDGSNVRRLTESKGWDGSPAWSADGKALYFYSERDGGYRIWTANLDGSEARPVSPAGTKALSPAVSPRGRIAYQVETAAGLRIRSIAADGSDERLESDDQRAYWAPAFDPRTGRMICHGTGSLDGLSLMGDGYPFVEPGGQAPVALPDRVVELRAVHGYFPSLSPSASQIVSSQYVSPDEAGGLHLVLSRLDGGGARVIFKPAPNAPAWASIFSPDGAWIAFCAGPQFAKPEANVDVWKVRPDGSGAVNLTADSNANEAFPDFSPDGRRIVFRSGRDGNSEIYLMDADGSSVRRLTKDPATDTMPAFSPRGDRIAFSSNREGDFEIYLLDLGAEGEPGALRRLTNSPGPDMHPRFSPDGKWLAFASARGGLNDEVPVNPTGPQPYGELWAAWVGEGTGSVVRLTHDKWEDSLASWRAARE